MEEKLILLFFVFITGGFFLTLFSWWIFLTENKPRVYKAYKSQLAAPDYYKEKTNSVKPEEILYSELIDIPNNRKLEVD